MQPVAPSFKRSMKTVGCLLITLSMVTPASSLFVVVPGLVQQAGEGALLGFVAAGIVSVLIACVYAELASAFPLSGGEYAMVGRCLGPLAGFVVLGLSLVALLSSMTVVVLGLGDYLNTVFPGTPARMDALACIAFTSLCAVLNIRVNAVVTGIFLLLELVAVVIVTVLGLAHPVRSWTGLVMHPRTLGAAGHLVPATPGSIGLAASIGILALYGFGSAVCLGEEVQDAPRRMAGTVLWAVVIGVLSQALPLAAALHGASDPASMFQSPTLFGDFVRIQGGPVLWLTVNLCVILAIINATIAIIILTARMVFSSGRDQTWASPINKALTRIHGRYGSPWIATLVTGSLSSCLCFVRPDLLLVMSGMVIVVVYALLCVAVTAGRWTGSTACAAYRMPLFPWPPLLALVAMVYVAYLSLLDPVAGRPGLVVAAMTIVISAVYYFVAIRSRGIWVLKDPAFSGSSSDNC